MMEHPDFKHGEIKIGFTPDEEIGRGVVKFDVKKFGAKYAYTMDGGEIGELEYENFNAAGAKIHIQGSNIHPGYGKDKMVNSMLIAMELNGSCPWSSVRASPRAMKASSTSLKSTEPLKKPQCRTSSVTMIEPSSRKRKL